MVCPSRHHGSMGVRCGICRPWHVETLRCVKKNVKLVDNELGLSQNVQPIHVMVCYFFPNEYCYFGIYSFLKPTHMLAAQSSELKYFPLGANAMLSFYTRQVNFRLFRRSLPWVFWRGRSFSMPSMASTASLEVSVCDSAV